MDSILDFAPYRLDLANEQMWRNQKPVALKPKTFAVLRYLAERPGELVTKEQLLEALWPEVYVSDAVLKTCVGEIRRAFEERASKPRYIETVHRRGYRFIAPFTSPPQALSRESIVQSQKVLPPPTSQSPAPGLVGREAELDQLQGWWQRALEGKRQIVFVTGEPGIGKTTLVESFLKQWTRSESVSIGRGQCVEQYGAGEAYLPLLESLGRLCREPAGAQLLAVLTQHAPTWLIQMPALLDGPTLEEVKQRVTGSTRERMLREIAEALETFTQTQPLILWLEDLHWADHSTIELLTYLARRSDPARLCVIGTYRPVDVVVQNHPLKTAKQELQLHQHCENLQLEFLSEAAVSDYLQQRFAGEAGGSSSLDFFAQLVHQQTEGNPLFMVNVVDEMVRQEVLVQHADTWQVVDQAAAVSVPLGLRQFIEQQVERVTPEARQILEAASVAGIQFSAAIVAAGLDMEVAAAEAHCRELAKREHFLRPHGVSEWPDGTVAAQFRFIHALYQETLYDRVPLSQRAEVHRRIGEREEAGYGVRTKEVAVELAMHFEQGHEYEKAMLYVWQAGENATQRFAHHEAVHHYSKYLALLLRTPETPERDQQELMLLITLGAPLIAAKGWAAPEVERTYTRASELCQQIGETPQLFPALAGLYRYYLVRAEYDSAYELARQLLHLAESVQDPTFLVPAYGTLGYVLFLRGEFRTALVHLEQSSSQYDSVQQRFFAELYGDDPGICSFAFWAWALWMSGYPDQALKHGQEALRLARDLAHPHVLTTILGLTAQLHRFRHESQNVQERATESLSLATQQGTPVWMAVSTILAGWVRAEHGEPEAGIAQIQQGLAAYQETGTAAEFPHYLTMLAEAYGKGRQPEAGLRALDEASAEMDRRGERFYEAEVYRLKGELTLQKTKGKKEKPALSRVEGANIEQEAEASFLQAIEIAQRQEAKSLELRATISLAGLWQRQGKKAEARQALAEIYDWFTEGFDTADLQEAKALLEALA